MPFIEPRLRQSLLPVWQAVIARRLFERGGGFHVVRKCAAFCSTPAPLGTSPNTTCWQRATEVEVKARQDSGRTA